MLPNVQVDGTLNVEGEVFIPSGATLSRVVELEGNQTISGVKTFSSSPVVPPPTAGTQAVNKDYVDNGAGAVFVSNDNRVKTALNASDTAPIYACRAWVNFNGTGTVAIRASGNVSSITDNGVGDYRVNFTTAMSDTKYSVASSKGNYPSSTPGGSSSGEEVYNLTATSFAWRYYAVSGDSFDVPGVSAVVFR